MPAAYRASQPKPIVPEKAYDAAFGTTTPADTYSRIQDTTLNWAGLTTPMSMQPKAIQELFDTDYGRMNSTLGTELPNTNAITQTTLPLEYIDPPTEIIKPSDLGTQVGSLNDGTQIWKITHNGVDTHSIHFHLFDVQVINRVGWDGAIRPPDPNELGWKDTVRMNPLEDAIVALRPMVPTCRSSARQRPAARPDRPLGTTTQFTGVDPTTGQPDHGRQQDVRLRLGVRLALPPARPRGERHDAADRLPGGAGRADEPGRLAHRAAAVHLTWTNKPPTRPRHRSRSSGRPTPRSPAG